MSFSPIDSSDHYRATITRTTERAGNLTVEDMDRIEIEFRHAWAYGIRENVLQEYRNSSGGAAPSRLWTALHSILDAADQHPADVVDRARRLHTLLMSAASCDAHEEALIRDARNMSRRKDNVAPRPVPPDCDTSLLPAVRRLR